LQSDFMATSPKAFLVELYREYLDDASFLRDQRRALRENPEVAWRDLEPFEERLEACLDGLVVGDELAKQVAQARANEGDPGELYAAVCLFCRREMRPLVMDLAQSLTADDLARLDAVGDALKQECPEAWFEELLHLASDRPQANAQLMLAARVAGYRRWKAAAPRLGRFLSGAPKVTVPDLLSALGRIGTPDTPPLLVGSLQDQDDHIRPEAAQALLRLREFTVVDFCLKAAPTQGWAAIPIALAGTRTAARTLLACARSATAQPEAILALGLLGDVSAVPVLIELLGKGTHPGESAQALQLITGAALLETAFVSETEEATDGGGGRTQAIRPDGKPYGSTVNRLALNPKAWQQWWSENEPRFNAELRYRSGQPCSPAVLLATIESPSSPWRIRDWAAQELRVRYGYDWPFEVEMPVKEQLTAIGAARSWVNQHGSKFSPGGFNCGG
jgi:uncharacterized protein (TIGR02270 family)